MAAPRIIADTHLLNFQTICIRRYISIYLSVLYKSSYSENVIHADGVKDDGMVLMAVLFQNEMKWTRRSGLMNLNRCFSMD